ncbi:DNA cytosine methyltransferase [Bacillus suaedaesalsae]|uniref:Cytosine-specific methyltransferase n=1 Tax=Bacillus suaedaesalsae TaxID=2810349 RepID=A0ABS2DEU0_9BACI|nr:DNA (cytosine-5-)-methyltransferase [Bacillus suaedaesalsae]MBM6616988.1 DNA (cytosine-5-)-methyltransferase [Bacillus suaedaesalsae]
MIKLATVFSGIGAIEQALVKKNIPHELVFASDNGNINVKASEEEIREQIIGLDFQKTKQYIDNLYKSTGKVNHVEESYFANYEITKDRFFQDVRFLDGTYFTDQVDLFVGGSPCQSFSINGKKGGLDDARGTLFYEYARLVQEIQPKVFIYENVPHILKHDGGKTWEVITSIFDSLNYEWHVDVLNARDFNLPQNRRRVFVVGFRKDLKMDMFSFPQKSILTKTVEDFLEPVIDDKYYLPEKGFGYTTNPKNKKRVSVNAEVSRCQAANQQFNWCGDFRFESPKPQHYQDPKIFVGEFEGIEGVVRKLTPRECLRLMGFSDDFNIVVPDQQLYMQSGNSIAVPVLEAIIDQITMTGVFEKDVTYSLSI